MTRAVIVGSGSEIAPNRVTNDMMARIMDTTDAWIRERSGVETRYFVDPGTATSPSRFLSPDGAVDLVFQPAAAHRDSRGLLLVTLSTTQLAGELSGTLPGPGGRPLQVKGLACLLEDRTARW